MKGPATSRYHAVVMGDLVRSERTGSVQHLHDRFNAAIDRENDARKTDLTSPLTITLGDEFQGLATSLTDAVAIARSLRYRLLSENIDCRFAIGLVELRTPLNPDKAWNMMGPGFARTREKLDEKRALSLYRFVVPDPINETMLEALGASLTMIERGWTDRQRDDILAALADISPAEIAGSRDVSIHSVYKVRQAGNFDTYLIQWRAVIVALTRIDAERRC